MAETGLKHILDGYKVLDFTQVLAGPTVTRLMAEGLRVRSCIATSVRSGNIGVGE